LEVSPEWRTNLQQALLGFPEISAIFVTSDFIPRASSPDASEVFR
jgi:hypothetical protein